MPNPIEWLMYSSILIPLKMYFNGGSNNWQSNMEGKVVVITGANCGMGFECAE